MSLKTPLIYYGGKTKLADLVISQLPPHERWVDVFGGGLAVTISKQPSAIEIVNDIGFVATFWRVLRDPQKSEELQYKLYCTPWSREEYNDCRVSWRDETDDVEKCRKWFALICQGFTHQEECNSWLVSKGVSASSAYANRVESLPKIAKRLRSVAIENYSFEHLLPLYDHPDTLFYCDPPYIAEARRDNGRGYADEMDERQHELLLEMLIEAKAQVVVSGYSNPLYDNKLKHWRLVTKMRQGQIHSGGQRVTNRIECIWIKEHSHGLWQEKGSYSNVSAIRP